MVAEALIASVGALTHGHDLIQESAAPDITILDVVKTVSATGDEAVDGPGITLLAMLAPVASKLQFGLLRGTVLTEAGEVDNEWHVSAIPAE